jgi:putative transposase
MARPLRIEFPGAVYHVTSRGNASASIYPVDSDRHRFLEVLAQVVKRFNWLCHAYCLMDNHYHLIIETSEANLSVGMRHLNGVYTQILNRRHNRVGHIFQGRFKAILIEKECHLLELCRYIVLNPVRAGVVGAPEQWIWSSYRATSGRAERPEFLTTQWVLANFSGIISQSQRAYRKFVREGVAATGSPWQKLSGQVFLGSEGFLCEMHELLREKEEIPEIPRRQRLADRPALSELFQMEVGQDKTLRDRIIREAHERHGYSQKEIALSLGLHYTTISKVINGKSDISRPDPGSGPPVLVKN